jgi:hypothetical protein
MKIGILTYHDINNYGAQLQAASVERFLTSNGLDAELVDFRPWRHEVRRNTTILRALKKLKTAEAKRHVAMNRSFRASISEMARVSSGSTMFASQVHKICTHYDVLVCGSDELWNFGNYLGYMAPYILDIPLKPGARKVSYAASIGSFKPDAAMKGRMKAALSSFNRILVRDPASLKLVSELGFAATRVLDPTFLADLNPISPKQTGYVMISGGLTSQQVNNAVDASRILGLKPISVGVAYPGHESLYVPATPREWIGFVKNASYHITSLFHGAALSLKYDTPFAVYVTPGKEQKIASLVDLFSAGNRQVPVNADGQTVAQAASTPLPAELARIRQELVQASQDAFIAAVRDV